MICLELLETMFLINRGSNHILWVYAFRKIATQVIDDLWNKRYLSILSNLMIFLIDMYKMTKNMLLIAHGLFLLNTNFL